VRRNLVWLIVAVGSVVGSFVAGPQLSSLNVSSGHEDHEQSQVAEAATLPLAIDWHYKIKEKAGDAASGNRVVIDDGYIDAENHCEICTRIEYTPGSLGQAGLAYAFDGPQDLSGAKSVTFFMMGEKGGEKVKFKAGGKGVTASSSDSEERAAGINNTNSSGRGNERGADPQNEALAPPGLLRQQFAVATEEVELENDWRKYSIDLEGLDLRSVTHPFGMEFPGKGSQKQVMIIKHIVYDDEASVNPLAASTENQTALIATQGLSVEISANTTNATSPATIEFRPNVSGGVAPYSLHLDFGNGNEIDTEQEGNQTESDDQTVTEVFEEPGSYNVTLDVEDSSNQTGSSSVAIEIESGETEEAAIELVIDANATEFEVAPATIEFEAEVNASDGEETFEYQWDFGDGTSAEEGTEDVVHTFEEPGSYNVTATATGSEGQSASSWIIVEVGPALAEDALDDSEIIDNSTAGDGTGAESEVEEDVVDNSSSILEDQDNTPPSPSAIDEILAYPGDTVVLDATQSEDEDSDELAYQWAQSSGPDVEIVDEDTPTPQIEIPDDIEEDDEIVMEVTVSDEIASAEPFPVTINVDFVESITEAQDEGADETELAPESDQVLEGWESDCNDIVECLSDEEADTFVSASGGDDEGIDEEDRPELLLSVEDFDEPLDEIHYVEIRADASKADVTGYLSFLIGEDEEQEPLFASGLVSIVTPPDDFGEYRLLLEEDPRTETEWTPESINSLLAGILYAGGQSEEVRISEFSLVVVYSAASVEESEPAEDEESMPEDEPGSELNSEEEVSDDAAEPEEAGQEDTDTDDVTPEEEQADQEEELSGENSDAATNSTDDQS
jgi:PKD repeat protein